MGSREFVKLDVRGSQTLVIAHFNARVPTLLDWFRRIGAVELCITSCVLCFRFSVSLTTKCVVTHFYVLYFYYLYFVSCWIERRVCTFRVDSVVRDSSVGSLNHDR
jgi:hypothetical protein